MSDALLYMHSKELLGEFFGRKRSNSPDGIVKRLLFVSLVHKFLENVHRVGVVLMIISLFFPFFSLYLSNYHTHSCCFLTGLLNLFFSPFFILLASLSPQ